jgi:hypothetical protein
MFQSRVWTLTGALAIGVAVSGASPPRAGVALIHLHRATGTPAFLRIRGEPPEREADAQRRRAETVLRSLSDLYGVRDPGAGLLLEGRESDRLGWVHLTFEQRYRGLPVYGARVRAHFDPEGRLSVLSGLTVPDIDVSSEPSVPREAAEARAVADVLSRRDPALRGTSPAVTAPRRPSSTSTVRRSFSRRGGRRPFFSSSPSTGSTASSRSRGSGRTSPSRTRGTTPTRSASG